MPGSCFYQAFGLTICSGFQIPELMRVNAEYVNGADVFIEKGEVPPGLENPSARGVRYQIKPGQFLLTVDKIARFLVSDGRRIIVEPFSSVAHKELSLFLLGSAFGALIHQRGMLPLHASAVKVGDECVVFCGASGNGKSTTAMEMVKRGYALHSDDLCVIAISNGHNTPQVYPGYPQLKLWADALEKFGADTSQYPRVRQVLEKYAVPEKERFNNRSLPLKKIYVLIPWEKEEIQIIDITGMGKFSALRNQTFRFHFVEAMAAETSHFQQAGFVGSCVPISRVGRPKNFFKLDQMADILEQDFLK